MTFYFRADSSQFMGSGHLMRCLTLADELSVKGGAVGFICRELPGNMCDFVERKGYQVHRLPPPSTISSFPGAMHLELLEATAARDAEETMNILKQKPPIDCLIVDHYALAASWEQALRPFAKWIMAIDDLADRPHDCDILLDQNLYADMATRYTGRVTERCQRLLGPHYALLRPDFLAHRKSLRERDGIIRRILVFFGGGDPSNETEKALKALTSLNRDDIELDVVVGGANAHRKEIRNMCASLPHATYHCQVQHMALLMVRADLAIGAGGTAIWERSCLGLPSVVTVIADNQKELTAHLAELGMLISLGWYDRVYPEDIAAAVRTLLEKPALVKALSGAVTSLVDGLGTERVVQSIWDIISNRVDGEWYGIGG